MGHNTYAEYSLKRTMAKTPTNVYKLLEQLLEAYKPVAINEYNAVQGFAMGMEKKISPSCPGTGVIIQKN